MTYELLQEYWWFLVSLLGALLAFLLFVANEEKGREINGEKYRN